MSKTQQPASDDPAPQPSRSTVVLMIRTLASTTWRMFVPTLSGVGIGYYADTQLASGPWWTLCGVMVGGAVSAGLVYKQLKATQS